MQETSQPWHSPVSSRLHPRPPCLHLPPLHQSSLPDHRCPLSHRFPSSQGLTAPPTAQPTMTCEAEGGGRPVAVADAVGRVLGVATGVPGCGAQLSRCAGPAWARTGHGVQDTAWSRSSGSSPYPLSPHAHLAFFSSNINETMPRSPRPSSWSISSVSSFPSLSFPWRSTQLLSQPSFVLKPFPENTAQVWPGISQDFRLPFNNLIGSLYPRACGHTLLELLSKENHGSHTLAIHSKVTLSFIRSKL